MARAFVGHVPPCLPAAAPSRSLVMVRRQSGGCDPMHLQSGNPRESAPGVGTPRPTAGMGGIHLPRRRRKLTGIAIQMVMSAWSCLR